MMKQVAEGNMGMDDLEKAMRKDKAKETLESLMHEDL